MSKTIGWDRRLAVSASGKNLVGHAGAVLLRACADRTGLTGALSGVMPSSAAACWWDRGVTLVGTAIGIVLGAVNLSDVERVCAQQVAVFGAPASDSTIHRALAAVDEGLLAKVAKAPGSDAPARVDAAAASAGRVPAAGRGRETAEGLDRDRRHILITAHSGKHSAAVTFKKTFGHHPLAASCANTSGSLAMLLRPGNTGSNTVADHITVLTEALRQIPDSSAAKILVRVDGAGATHDLLAHLQGLNTTRRTVRYSVSWKMTDADETAIAQLPEAPGRRRCTRTAPSRPSTASPN